MRVFPEGDSGPIDYSAQRQQFAANYRQGIGHWRGHPLSQFTKELVIDAKSLLDIGTGGAEKAIEIAERNRWLRVIGLDYAEPGLISARKAVDRQRLSVRQRISLVRGDALNLPLPDQSIDAAHDYLCFTHIHKKDWQRYFAEVARVVRNEILIVTFSKEDKDFYGYPIRDMEEDWVVFRNDHDGTPRPHLAINDGYGYHFARGHQLVEAIKPYFPDVELLLKEHPHPDHKGKRYLWHLLAKKG